MKPNSRISPPTWARNFLAWYCKPGLLEDLEGDLHECFERNVRTRGPQMARIIYVIDVLKFLRPYTVRKPKVADTLTHFIMVTSYIKTSGRNIFRNQLFSFINIVGLAVSMAVGLLLIAMLHDLWKYDRFHENYDRIYRITSRHQYLLNKNSEFQNEPFATSSPRAAFEIKNTFPGVDDLAILQRDFSGDFTSGDKTIPLSGLWANEGVLSVFSFPLVHGNVQTALKEPFSVLLTQKSAEKLFGETDVVGRTITFNDDREWTVTGVMKDIPVFSHIQFDILGSYKTREIVIENKKYEMAWDNMWDAWAYVLLKEGTDLALFQRNLDDLSVREDKTVDHTHIGLSLYPLEKIVSGENQSNQIGPIVGSTVVRILSILTAVVILSACFNYTNLSIARTLRRSREVGIRKAVGASKTHVTMQYLVESVFIALLGLIFAFGIFLFLRSHFIGLEESLQRMLVLDLSPELIVIFIAFAVAVGLVAGILPATFFSRLNTIQVLKNLSGGLKSRKLTLRKTLIVFQYTISIAAITATLTMYKQYKHFITFDLGFNTANVVNIRLQGANADVLQKELSELHEVSGISRSALIQGLGNFWATGVKNPDVPLDSGTAFYNFIDSKYLDLHDFTLLAGRNFTSKADSTEESEMIVNEHFLKRFEVGNNDPQDAIGKQILVNRRPLTIVGVAKNFEYGKADTKRQQEEVMLRHAPDEAQYLNVKILSSDWPATMRRIETVWKKIDPVHPLDAKFYDVQIEEAYQGLKASMKVGGFLAFLVICIASIGLLGMVVFSTETRLREISIRKVLGASEAGLLYLLSKGFVSLLVVASVVGLAITYAVFSNVILPQLANAAPLTIWEGLLGVLVVLSIALTFIGTHTLKVSRTNPAEVLKTE
jgi:ABC-type antimicrobial peptide transport system permease subunit